MHFPLEPHHVTCRAFILVVGPESQSLVPTTMLAKTGRDLQKKKKKIRGIGASDWGGGGVRELLLLLPASGWWADSAETLLRYPVEYSLLYLFCQWY